MKDDLSDVLVNGKDFLAMAIGRQDALAKVRELTAELARLKTVPSPEATFDAALSEDDRRMLRQFHISLTKE